MESSIGLGCGFYTDFNLLKVVANLTCPRFCIIDVAYPVCLVDMQSDRISRIALFSDLQNLVSVQKKPQLRFHIDTSFYLIVSSRFNQCYGILGILDRLHNTDNLFRASKNYQRHVMHFSLTPVKVAFPEDKKSSKPE